MDCNVNDNKKIYKKKFSLLYLLYQDILKLIYK